ncbi:valine--tRNA ligase [Halodesulfovibrio sp.]|jgi:valyl-tRNA synthetase|uniref:valine--tRNA ligase n=1 Tax=Halodesulfovibrio sp. TaxID=1912772 RepID=UPI0025EFA523|nr:valine--tRNA ligase [Halodesulfovibrio sp.]MCT4626344.1 valine--tRNA ligase [Halodesulfovibrio sp.]
MAENALSKGYESQTVEDQWRKHWEENNVFTPDMDAEGEAYSIVIPPPNVTGALHMGHALNLTLQDILCRYQRQKGKKVLWVPGTDHAGIATQNVVERKLATEGLGRHDLGREKFVERVWDWREEYGSRILNQVRKMGASVDWTRERFTMDEGLSKAVRKVFVELHEQGLIYKGDYIINWCPRCHTALADDEVDHANEPGALHYIKYPLAEGSGDLIIATTRPETMLADTAIAVNPDDERFSHLIGKKAILPLVGRELEIIGDRYVDIEFGTGCLKVTPAHDHNDWELGRKHGLEVMNILNEDGTLTEDTGDYAGLTCVEARVKILEELKAGGYLDRIEEHEHSVGHCYRCKTIVEPFVSTQWFVAMTKLAPRARAAVPELTQIFPESWIKTYNHWLDNIRDWCISRQIWWGHRIPAWTCQDCGELIVATEDPTSCKCGSTNIVQDEDVLDTWFSSALWPFSTMGWPDKTKELDTFYPTSVLVTGFDILFFWVARMMMMGLHFMDEVPFHHVYIHALVRDEKGKKMSKSTGNVIDPVEMIDKYGCDSLRFTLTSFAAMGRDIKLSEQRIDGYRNFCNKIWNAARFALMNLPEEKPKTFAFDEIDGVHHRWILSRLESVKKDMDNAITSYHFNESAQIMYKFIWNEFCDWYLELIKPDMRAGGERAEKAQFVLWTVLQEMMVILHPIMPFITAQVWSVLPGIENKDIATELYPEMRPACEDNDAEAAMTLIQETIVAVRTIKAELNVAPQTRLNVLIRTASDEAKALYEDAMEVMQALARLNNVELGADVEAPKASASSVVQGNEVIVPLEGLVNFEDELARLDKELGKVEKDLKQASGKLRNESFVNNAPAAIVEKEKARAAELEDTQQKLLKLQKRLVDAMG